MRIQLTVFAALLVIALASFAGAVPSEVCGNNGYYDSSINDCRFITNPGELRFEQTGICGSQLNYNCNDGHYSKYKNACVGNTYYDFSGSTASINTWKSGSLCFNSGDYCSAQLSSCGYYDEGEDDYDDDYGDEGDDGYDGYDGGSGGYDGGYDWGYGGGYYYSPSCELSSFPHAIYAGSDSEINVQYFDLPYSPWSVLLNCGNGQSSFAYYCFGTTGSCYASCHYDSPGTYYVSAPYYLPGGAFCGYSVVNVLPRSQGGGDGGDGGNGGLQTCSDGTYYNQCSISQPKYCFNGNLIDKASSCGCPSGLVRDGERCVAEQHYPYCTAYANPSYLPNGGSTNIEISYSDFASSPQSTFVICGQGTTSAQCLGGKSGHCTAVCSYSNQQAAYGVDVFLDTVKCSTQVSVGGGNGNPSPSVPPVFPRSCSVQVATQIIPGSGSTNVLVTYDHFSQAPSFKQLTCPDFSSLRCTGTNSTGSCAGTCSYGVPPSYPTTYTIGSQLDDVRCSSSSVTLVRDSGTPTQQPTGGISLTVLESGSNAPVENAFAVLYFKGNSIDTAYTSYYGTAAFADLESGGYSITASKIGFSTKSQSVQLNAGETKPVTIMLDRTFASTSCSVSLNPYTVRAGDSTDVSINFQGVSQIPSTALVSCGNGYSVSASCSGSQGSGSCNAQCSYGSEQSYPVYRVVSSSINGAQCSSATATVIAPQSTTGGLSVRVTDCVSGKGLSGASVSSQGVTYYADSYGVAVASGIAPGVYELTASFDGYFDSSVTAIVNAGKTTSKSVCLNKRTVESSCDFGAQIIKSPTCPYSENPQPYQLKLSNKLNANNSLSLVYSNDAISGPTGVFLLPLQETIVDLTSDTQDDFAGGNNVFVTVSNANCTRNILIQACQSGGLSVDAIENEKTAFQNQRTCFPLIVRNRGLASAQVTLSASPSQEADYDFAPRQFTITPQETKNVDFCVTAKSSGAITFVIDAQSPINDATASVVLNVPSQSMFSTNSSDCVPLSSSTTVTNYALSLYNSALSGDYEIEIGWNDLNAIAVQEKLYGFEKGTYRAVDLRLDGFGKTAGEHKFDVRLKKDGVVAFQQTLCFNVEGVQNAFAQLKPVAINVRKDSSGTTFLTVRNTGSVRSTYSITTPNTPLITILSPSSFSLNPDDEATAEISVAASSNNESKAYVIPIKLFAQSGYSGSPNSYSVDINCGNGQTRTQTCSVDNTYCSVSCEYPSTGTFYPYASIGGSSCTTNDVRVIETKDNACIVSPNQPHLLYEESTGITITYQGLSVAPENFTINCGNGVSVTATGCTGTTGACSSTSSCYYEDSGRFTVSATSTSGSCSQYGASVMVSDEDDKSCDIGVYPATILRGSQSTITLHYYNLDEPTSSSYSQYGLIDSFSLLVNVLGAGGTTSFEPVVSDTIQIVTPDPVEMTPGSSITVPIVVKNNNYYSLSSVLFSAVGLPAGFTIQPVSPFALEPQQEKTVSLYITADKNVYLSTYSVRLKAQSAMAVSPEKTLSLRVKPAAVQLLAVQVGSPSFAFSSSGTTESINMTFTIKNDEATQLVLQPALDLPQGWSYYSPALTIQPGKTETFVLALTAPDYTPGEYNATMSVQAGDKVKTVDFVIPSSENASPFAGFFTASGSVAAIAVLILCGIALAAYLLYRAKENEEQAEEKTDGEQEKN